MTASDVKIRAQLSFAFWIAVFGQILNDERKLISPRLNILQLRFARGVEWCIANKRPLRFVILKPRQVGGTSIASGCIYWLCRVWVMNCIFIADILNRSKKLFAMFKRFASTDLLNWMVPYSETDKTIDFDNGSRAEMLTAENPAGSRADTLQALHISELAYWPRGGVKDAKKTLTALEGSLATHPQTIEVIESTGNGPFGVFPERFWDAHWPEYDDYWKRYGGKHRPGGRDSIFIRIFAAWWEFDIYRLKISAETEAHVVACLSHREKQGVALYGWTLEQIAWRRWAIANKCSGSERAFDEEYPENPEICFQASGYPRFSVEGMAYLELGSRSQPWNFGMLTDVQEKGDRPAYVPTGLNEAWFQKCEEPTVGLSYLLAADISSDRDMAPQGSDAPDRDKHSVGVLRAAYTDDKGLFHREKLVARIIPGCEDGHTLLAKKIHLLSLYYGNCVIIPEMNNHGLNVASKLQDLGANLICRTVEDPVKRTTQEIYGWTTTEHSRAAILDALADAIRDANEPKETGIHVFCSHAVAEMMSFQKGKDRAEAAVGCHDDDVLMLAIGHYNMSAATRFRDPRAKRREPAGYRPKAPETATKSSMPGF